MRIKINDRTIDLPERRADFTLGERCRFHTDHGALLDKMLDSIDKMPEGVEQDLERLDFHFEKMARVFAFFTGCTPQACKQADWIETVGYHYTAYLQHLIDSPKDDGSAPQTEFDIWDGRWILPEPTLSHGCPMTFGEVIDAKQMVSDIYTLEQGRWEAIRRLGAIFLRRPGEPFAEEFLYADSPRLKLMNDLPMEVAHQVAFFLSGSMTSLKLTLMFSRKARPRQPDRTCAGTSKCTAGSISSNRSPRQRFLTYRAAA